MKIKKEDIERLDYNVEVSPTGCLIEDCDCDLCVVKRQLDGYYNLIIDNTKKTIHPIFNTQPYEN